MGDTEVTGDPTDLTSTNSECGTTDTADINQTIICNPGPIQGRYITLQKIVSGYANYVELDLYHMDFPC